MKSRKNSMDTDTLNFKKSSGLIPVIVQDARTGFVLMQGWMNREALDKTKAQGTVTFFSRSKKRLWTKGETSGNFLRVKNILADCDRDCLLIKAIPSGPVCHTGQETCFGETKTAEDTQYPAGNKQPGDELLFLGELEQLLRKRKTADPEKSYTSMLLASGPKRIAKKLGEEAVELVLEADNNDDKRFIEEAADLLYHLDVLLISRSLGLRDIVRELKNRHKS